MKSVVTGIALAIVTAAWDRPLPLSSPAVVAPDAVVARIDGRAVTAAEVMSILQANPPEAQKNLLKDAKGFLQRDELVKKLAAMAEKAHLEQQSPTKESLDRLRQQYEMARRQAMAQAHVTAAIDAILVSADEQKKFYQEHRDRYAEARVKVLFLSFRSTPTPQTDPAAKKYLTEAEAKAKAEKLLAQIRGGADFVKLLKENSDDKESVARDGDFGQSIKRSDEVPENIRNAIFSLKAGEVSEPVRVSNGFYLFRLEQLVSKSFDEVRDDIFIEIRQNRFREWMTTTEAAIDVKIENPDFFSNAVK